MGNVCYLEEKIYGTFIGNEKISVSLFSGVSVLKNNHLELEAGEVHALLGENGAGKSTLIKILGGVYTKDSGQILVDGQEVEITGVESAKEHGIRIIHQELMLIPDMTISENIFYWTGTKNKSRYCR